MAVSDGPNRFEPAVQAWRERSGSVRDHVRQELVARQLAGCLEHVEADGGPRRALDAGCGQGTQVIRLARAGLDVVGLDLSDDLLHDAREALTREPDEVRDRVRLAIGDVVDLSAEHHGAFDLVCCHGVVMYLDSLDDAVAGLAAALRPGGVLSVLSRNRAGIAMRAGMEGRWTSAVEGFDATHYRNRLGVPDARAHEPEDVFVAFASAGLRVRAWYGVRLFTDHWGDQDPPDDLDALLEAEDEAGRRDPYRRLAALTHTLGVLER